MKSTLLLSILNYRRSNISGNCNLANISNEIGAVGSIPPLLAKVMPFGLIKVNQTTGEPERDENGFCIR